MMHFKATVSLTLLVLLPSSNAIIKRDISTKILFTEDFEDGQVVGEAVVGAEISPSIPSENLAVVIIGPSNNPAGTGNAVRIVDKDSKKATGIAYNFVESVFQQVSTLEVHLSFSILNDSSGSGHYFAIALGEVNGAFTSRLNRFIDVRLYSDGTIDFRSTKGPDSSNNSVKVRGYNTLSMYANDYNIKSITYNNPDDSGTNNLPPNSIAYWLNGNRILFGGEEYTFMEDRNTLKGTVFESENNFGRFGINSYTRDYGIDIMIDELRISTIIDEFKNTQVRFKLNRKKHRNVFKRCSWVSKTQKRINNFCPKTKDWKDSERVSICSRCCKACKTSVHSCD